MGYRERKQEKQQQQRCVVAGREHVITRKHCGLLLINKPYYTIKLLLCTNSW